MEELLSQLMKVLPSCFTFKRFKILLTQMHWQTHEADDTNSASVVESVTIGCFLEDQHIALVPIVNMYPEVLFLSS
jgi:hypothetical protein